ncbi:MAG: hypothetical protein HY549_08125 [Elusimicrobia bacterium]|nr:hypothetical protein [Elusimicrobiota bacterium]
MPPWITATLLGLALATPSWAQEAYGHKGIFPVYETAGQWVIFDKKPSKASDRLLSPGSRFLIIGSSGSQVFDVARTSATYGGACREKRPVRLKAALLKGPRRIIGRPITAISVPPSFILSRSRAVYRTLPNEVSDATYAGLGQALKLAAVQDVQSGRFALNREDPATFEFLKHLKLEFIQIKIDFASRVSLPGLSEPLALVEETQIGASIRRCFRLANGERLIGPCVEMPRVLMAETGFLDFVSYDPQGRRPQLLVLAYTKTAPLWGDERWGFVLRSSGPQLLLKDTLDPRCRESF